MSDFNSYDIGDTAKCYGRFWVADEDGNETLTDPGAVTCEVKPPTGEAFTLTYGVDEALEKISTGVYVAKVSCTEAKKWRVFWTGEAPAKSAEPWEFFVRAKPF